MQFSDTICAISTPNGVGAIGMIRLSGPKSWEIISSVFSKKTSGSQSHTLHFGTITNEDGKILDEVLISLFAENKSFTGEESAEIACHGSSFILQQVLSLLVRKGCRIANPGEFTQRAFLNGKMDLSQAEAVADLIASESRHSHELALNQLRGKFSSELKDLREKLIHFASLVELELDFAEEDVEFADRTQLLQLVEQVLAYIQKLISSFELGNAIKNGVPVAIIGAPNTGKSTLLNQLLGEEKAIVSNIAGTTRDVIEDTLNIDGILFRLIDTAGIREGAEEIEAMGIERSFEKLAQAKIVLVLSDNSPEASANKTMSTQEASFWISKLKDQYPAKTFALLANKSDLTNETELPTLQTVNLLKISAKNGDGIETLKAWLVDSVTQGRDFTQDTIVTNARHVEALEKAAEALLQAKNGLEMQTSGDFVAMDIRQAMFHLGSITGDISTDDLLGNIFSKFCIGK